MNVTDLAVSPDGAIYFTMGGRGSQGGVYRIVPTDRRAQPAPASLEALIDTWPQPQAALGLHNPARRIGVALLWGLQAGEPAEDNLRRGVEQALQLPVVTHHCPSDSWPGSP